MFTWLCLLCRACCRLFLVQLAMTLCSRCALIFSMGNACTLLRHVPMHIRQRIVRSMQMVLLLSAWISSKGNVLETHANTFIHLHISLLNWKLSKLNLQPLLRKSFPRQLHFNIHHRTSNWFTRCNWVIIHRSWLHHRLPMPTLSKLLMHMPLLLLLHLHRWYACFCLCMLRCSF